MRMKLSAVMEPSLEKDDTLWSGLTFQLLTVEELAARQSHVEERVHFHRGVWWRQAKSFFCLPCELFAKVDARVSSPHPLRALGGYMHLAANGAPSNATFPAIVRDDVSSYRLANLSKYRRHNVRRAVHKVQVRPIEDLQGLLSDGYEVYVSWHERVQWGRNKGRQEYKAWMTREFQQPKNLALGAYRGDKLVAFTFSNACGETAMLNFAVSHSDYMDTYANDLLYHALLSVARQTPGIERFSFGPASSKGSLDHFKLHYATVKSLRAYLWLNPIVRVTAGKYLARRYPWLSSPPQPQDASQ